MQLKRKGSAYIPETTASYAKYVIPNYKNVLGWSDKSEKIRNEIILKELLAKIRKTLEI